MSVRIFKNLIMWLPGIVDSELRAVAADTGDIALRVGASPTQIRGQAAVFESEADALAGQVVSGSLRRQGLEDANPRAIEEHVEVGAGEARTTVQQLRRAQFHGASQAVIAQPLGFGVAAHALDPARPELLGADERSARHLRVHLG